MRSGPPDEVLSGAAAYGCVVSSSLGGVLLEKDIPILGGHVTAATSQAVPERLTISVPRWDGRDWRPGDVVDHPLAKYGQELTVSIMVWSTILGEWETRIGKFLIIDWDDGDQGSIVVHAFGMLHRTVEAKITSPLQPLVGGTLMSEARRLMPLGMSVAFDPALTDRACPPGMVWSSDRLKALQEIADAWPALLRTDQWGQAFYRAPLAAVPVPVLELRDGERGTLISAPRSDTREGAYNQIVVRSSATDRQDVQVVVSQSTGPMRVDGPYGAVTREFASPLIGSVPEAQAAGTTMLANSLVPTRTVSVRCVPDPRIDLDDPIQLVRDGVRTWGWVTGYDLPLTVSDGEMRVEVGVAA